MSTLARFWQQSFFLPSPQLTEHNLPDQSGRVFIVTGGYGGVGYELSKILYQRNGTVYVAGRSPEKAKRAINTIKQAHAGSEEKLEFLILDLGGLGGIKASAEAIPGREERLDVLVDDACVMQNPLTSTTHQTHELQLGTNCLGPFLLTKLLTPPRQQTARAVSTPAGSVRVLWAGSVGIEVRSPANGGMDLSSSSNDEARHPVPSTKDTMLNYRMSKVGNLFLASQFVVRTTVPLPLNGEDDAAGKGLVSLCFNPGNLRTELQREMEGVQKWASSTFLLYLTVMGSNTKLSASCGEESGRIGSHGGYVFPWCRMGDVRADIQREVEAGKKGEGKAVAFWEW
ncbi:hypothetical protein B0A55_04208 [Friedmanniomyces simplex]|uniref:Ketoreductase (KR) domain-containing protein n=1 Tax=Friedmanniomyces simplex TaxID=329884 RepID=A0A4U0XUL9_9PEZI|nr:hypothetical protein B0A55_04208 [Friedmanniomyces simplex]